VDTLYHGLSAKKMPVSASRWTSPFRGFEAVHAVDHAHRRAMDDNGRESVRRFDKKSDVEIADACNAQREVARDRHYRDRFGLRRR
jgi:hypothetical protein